MRHWNRPIPLLISAMLTALTLQACREWQPAPGTTFGEDVYRKNCITCHGVNGGGADGPNLIDRERTPDQVAAMVIAGAPGMPAAADRKPPMTPEEITAVAEYVSALSRPRERGS